MFIHIETYKAYHNDNQLTLHGWEEISKVVNSRGNPIL